MTTTVPSIAWGAAGPVLPQESAILAGVLTDMQTAFGGELTVFDGSGNPILTTPVGQLASSQAAVIGDKNDQMAFMVNMVDPAYSSGPWQDAIGRIYFLSRRPSEPTVLQVACLGASGTVIAIGTKIRGVDGSTYASTQAGTIPFGGSITLPFANLVAGAITPPTSVSVYRALPGLDSVTLVSGVIGADVESPADFEFRRQQSVAINASGTLASIYANVFAVPGVLDVYATENVSASAAPVGSTSYSVAPKSVYVAVVGGNTAAVAKAIWSRKTLGCNYNGNTTVTVQDTSGYNAPYPSYSVKFNVPTATPVLFSVQIINNPTLPSNIVDLIKAAIISAFAGGDGGPRARIGSTILASRFYAPVASTSATLGIISILVGTSTPSLTSVTIGIDQVPTITASNITVTLV